MGILGKVFGFGVGMMVGGPLGAVIGGALGHQYDKAAGQTRPRRQLGDGGYRTGGASYAGEDMQTIFMVSLISMAAKIAKADGYVASAEVDVLNVFLKNELHMSTAERKMAARIFNEAKEYHGDYLAFASQFHNLAAANPQMLVAMTHLLFKIAAADGKIDPTELSMIEQVARTFRLTSDEFNQIKSFYIKDTGNAYAILGVSSAATDAEVKAAYRKLVNQYHPDKMVGKGLPEDFVKFANQKVREINDAYGAVKKERGL